MFLEAISGINVSLNERRATNGPSWIAVIHARNARESRNTVGLLYRRLITNASLFLASRDVPWLSATVTNARIVSTDRFVDSPRRLPSNKLLSIGLRWSEENCCRGDRVSPTDGEY